LAGAWTVSVADPRFGGFSSLTIDQGRFLAVSDRGAVTRFDLPGLRHPQAWVADLRDGPGPWGRKWARDAESLAADPGGRGWWIGFEQNHSIWLYDQGFGGALTSLNLNRPDWWNNRGAEGLLTSGESLIVIAENGRGVMRINPNRVERISLHAGTDVADAATAPDGNAWLLTRSKSWRGIGQSIAPLWQGNSGFRAGPAMPLPKGALDNYEGMAIEPRPGGGLRFWLISDDGHRIMARTLLVALDLAPPARLDKSPATIAGLSRKPAAEAR